MRVLVVDDAADIATWLSDELKLLGAEVRVSYDAASALDEIAVLPDAMLIDIALLLMNGWELARQVRQLQACRLTRTPIRAAADSIDTPTVAHLLDDVTHAVVAEACGC